MKRNTNLMRFTRLPRRGGPARDRADGETERNDIKLTTLTHY